MMTTPSSKSSTTTDDHCVSSYTDNGRIASNSDSISVGIIGYSSPQFDEDLVKNYLFDEFIKLQEEEKIHNKKVSW